MRLRYILLAVGFLLSVSAASAQLSPGMQDKLNQKPDTEKVNAIILTQPHANEKAKKAVKNSNGNVKHDFSIIDGVAVEIPEVAAENLAKRSFVREIQPDYTVETILSESTQTVKAEKVWNQNVTGEGIDVAVLDTGIEDTTILKVESQVDYTGEGTDDLNGHGTHVAGIIASPNKEYRGVAYGADILDVKVLNQEGSGTASDVIAGLEYAVDNNADIATLSLGATVEECDGTSAISEAVDKTVENGVAVTTAAGNNGPDSETITAPGCAEKPITVGSSGNGQISDFSSRGPTADGRVKPDIVAPGESITSLWKNNGDGPQFNTISGTSMATPHVAGTAALLLAEKGLNPSEIKNITTYTAKDLGYDENSQGSGRLDAYSAYQQIANTENTSMNQAPSIEAVDTKVNLLNNSAEAEFTVEATDKDNQSLDIVFYLNQKTIQSQKGYGKISYTEKGLELNKTYFWRAEATDRVNKSTTETTEFKTDVKQQEDENKTRNMTKPELPEQASDRARQARGKGGLFTPTSRLYGIDLALDRASVALGLRSRESVMQERAQEARQMTQEGNQKAAERAVTEMRKTAGNTENATKKAEETLKQVMEDAPEEARKGLQNALRNVEKERGRPENKSSREPGKENANRGEKPSTPENSERRDNEEPKQKETPSQNSQSPSNKGQPNNKNTDKEGQESETGNSNTEEKTGNTDKRHQNDNSDKSNPGKTSTGVSNSKESESSENPGNSGSENSGGSEDSSPGNSGSSSNSGSKGNGNSNGGGPPSGATGKWFVDTIFG